MKFSISQPMTSASGEAAKHGYKVYHGRSGRRWLVADTDTPAENIYVEDPRPGSLGFGGRTLTFG